MRKRIKKPLSEADRFKLSKLTKVVPILYKSGAKKGQIKGHEIQPTFEAEPKVLFRTKANGSLNGVQTMSNGEQYQKANHLAKSVKITGKARQKAQNDAQKAGTKAMRIASQVRRDEFIQQCRDTFFKIPKRKRIDRLGFNNLTDYINSQLQAQGY